MNNTAIVITAIAGQVTAIGAVIAAVSKLAPLTKEVNKMLADHHKRWIAAKSNTDNQHKASHAIRSRTSRIIGIGCVVVGIIGMLVPIVFNGESASQAIVICSLAIILSILGLSIIITDSMLQIMLNLSTANFEGLLSIIHMLRESEHFPIDEEIK